MLSLLVSYLYSTPSLTKCLFRNAGCSSTPQYECERCERFFTPSYPAVAEGAHATERFLAHCARLIDFADIANVAGLFGVPKRTMARWYYDYIQRRQQHPLPAPLKPIESIGIDELSQKKSTDSSLR
jgi:hypothetical protein